MLKRNDNPIRIELYNNKFKRVILVSKTMQSDFFLNSKEKVFDNN